MQGAHAVGPERVIQSQHRHFENIALAPFKPPHPHEFRPRQADALGIRQEVRLHPFQPETLVPGVHGRMRCKQAASAHEFPRFGEGEPPLLHEQADTLKDEERGMPLVHMIHGGPDAEGAHELDPAHAEQNFLTEAAIPVSLVQPGGDLAIVGGIAGRVGVQQIQLDPPHTHHPDLRMETPPRKLQQHFERRSALILDQLQRQRGEIVFRSMTLEEIFTRLERKYPYTFVYSFRSLKEDRFNLTFGQNASMEEVMDIIARVTGNLDYKIVGDKCYISGTGEGRLRHR